MSATLYEDITSSCHGGIQAVTFLGYRPSFNKFVALEILTWESMGKPKMWNISKTATRRVKWPNFGTRDTTHATVHNTAHM